MKLNEFTQKILRFCFYHTVWITTVPIQAQHNTDANTELRKYRRESEWVLNTNIFEEAISRINVCPNIDLYASRLNYKVKPSYQLDHEAFIIKAFYF